jgi:large subunit ribosomal protein L23
MSRINPTPAARKFDEGRLMQVLVAPVVSEKATSVADKTNAVTFKVLQNATKPEIKAAVELMFKVEVQGVSVVNTKGKTKQLAARFKAMNLESVLVIADEIDENLYLASRNLVNVLVVEPRYADPLSLVHFKKVLVTKGAMDKLKEMFA